MEKEKNPWKKKKNYGKRKKLWKKKKDREKRKRKKKQKRNKKLKMKMTSPTSPHLALDVDSISDPSSYNFFSASLAASRGLRNLLPPPFLRIDATAGGSVQHLGCSASYGSSYTTSSVAMCTGGSKGPARRRAL